MPHTHAFEANGYSIIPYGVQLAQLDPTQPPRFGARMQFSKVINGMLRTAHIDRGGWFPSEEAAREFAREQALQLAKYSPGAEVRF